MNAIDIWVMSQLFVPNVSGGTTKTLLVSYANAQALRKLEKEKMVSLWAFREADSIPIDEWVYQVKLTDIGLEYMSNYVKLPKLSVGQRLEYSGNVFTYAYKEKKTNGEIVVWMRDRRRELRGVPARMVNFAK